MTENAAIWTGGVASSFASGEGTEESPYMITTAQELAYLASTVNAGNKYSGKYIALANDINLSDTTIQYWEYTAKDWVPIGTSSVKCFSGTFDGGDYTIRGLCMDKDISNYGLFGYIRGGTIINVNIVGMFIRGKSCVGGIAGIAASESHISNCHIDGLIHNGYQGYTLNYSCGGIVGHLSASTIDYCTSTGAIVGNYCGGIAGKIVSGSYVTESDSSADVYGMSLSAGGIVGWESGSSDVNNCDFTGNVIGTKSGGIIGCLEQSYVYSCINDGSVSDNGTASTVGGIVGTTLGSSTAPASVTDCVNDGTVNGYIYVGGIVGRLEKYSDVTGCTNTGEINGNTNVGGICGYSEAEASVLSSFNTGSVSGISYSGGIVGVSRSTVALCGNGGAVLGFSDSTGGIAGFINGSSTASDCLNTGDVTGGAGAGGLVGESQTATVMCSVNLGSVSGNNKIAPIAGISSDTVYESTYYLNDCTDGSAAPLDGTRGLTAEEAANAESYEGLDFSETWVMRNGAAALAATTTAVDIPNTLTVDYGDTQTLNLTIIPENSDYISISWESSSPETASVNESGEVTAHALGTAEITVTLETDSNTYTDTCLLTVACLSHKSTEIIPAVAATCTQSGLTEGKNCKICGAAVTTQLIVPAMGHSFGEWVSNSDGTHTRTCKNDNTHNETAECEYNNIITPSTCTEKGYTTCTCNSCGYSFKTDYTDALGHDWSIYSSNGNGTHTVICARDASHTMIENCYDPNPETQGATCESGIKTVTSCIYCSGRSVFVHEGTEKKHEYVRDEARDIPPTELAPGVEAYTCTECGGYNDIEIPALSTWHVAVSGINVSAEKDLYCEGESTYLSAEISPSDASYKGLIWSSSMPEVASVDENGRVTWHSRGKVTFTATSTDPYTPACGSLTVSGGYSYPTYTVNFILINPGNYSVNGIEYNNTASLTFRAGENISFDTNGAPVDAENGQYESSAAGIYTVTDIHNNITVTITPELTPTTPIEPVGKTNSFINKIIEFFKMLLNKLAALFGG